MCGGRICCQWNAPVGSDVVFSLGPACREANVVVHGVVWCGVVGHGVASWELGKWTARNGHVSELCHLDRPGMGVAARAPTCTSSGVVILSWHDAARRAELFSS